MAVIADMEITILEELSMISCSMVCTKALTSSGRKLIWISGTPPLKYGTKRSMVSSSIIIGKAEIIMKNAAWAENALTESSIISLTKLPTAFPIFLSSLFISHLPKNNYLELSESGFHTL